MRREIIITGLMLAGNALERSRAVVVTTLSLAHREVQRLFAPVTLEALDRKMKKCIVSIIISLYIPLQLDRTKML